MFFTEAERLETIRACRDCPMCHMIDTVTQITGRESNTPRGRAMILWGLEKGLLSWESEGVAPILYQAFLDGLAREWCEGNYDNDELVIDGRKNLVEKGLAPAVVADLAAVIQNRGNPYGVKEEGVSALIKNAGGKISPAPEIAVFFGSAARTQRPQVVKSFIKILKSIRIPFEVLEGETDSGFLSYQLGDFKTAGNQAKKVVDLLAKTRAKKLVVLSASDFRMLTLRYARFGAPLPGGMQALHVTEFLSQLQDEGKLIIQRKEKRTVTYHDPCCLARSTYVLDPPRQLLKAIGGENFVEMEWSGKKAHSCGGCAGVPFTYPEISAKAARIRVEQALLTGAKVLASADPGCEAALCGGVSGKEIEVKNIVELVADAL
jgi:Fe-S oxidoreductase